ncbi:DDE-type integrase/transposase/recombinase [Microvirga terrestris]|uniref:IS6 family transposase n=1 Tax=Microvirga terrestris TaxID=2791024 RepID=A0ABS0HWM9_9HYPH|nr:DDE-type integrase/transposase/recombinase [Microvirga terrestris]MBF9197888.1 IS6 family transposase [Microvirga terrestris]
MVTISGQKHWLWRAVDHDGYALNGIVQSRRDTKAAKCVLKRLLRKQGCAPRRMITDKLGSYAAARRQVMPDVEHRSQNGFNSGGEFASAVSPTTTGRQGFRSAGGLQRFINVFSAVCNLLVPPRSRRSARALTRAGEVVILTPSNQDFPA